MGNGEFAGRIVLVTGAAGAIGSACVDLLRKRGAYVIGTDIRSVSSADVHVQVDLANINGLHLICEATGERPLFGLVNNAAESTAVESSLISQELWDRMFAVNVRAPFFLGESLLRNLEQGLGSVVNVASVHAFATSVGSVPYATTKGALCALTRSMAVDWSARGLASRVNAVAPAATDSPMLRDSALRTGVSVETVGNRHPVGRVAHPAEIAEVICFLLSPAASFMHGVVVPIDGGALAQLSTEVR